MLTPARRPASMSARASRGAKHCEIPKWEFLLRSESTLRAPTYATIRSFMGWTMGFEPTTTGITKRRFAPCALESQRLAIRRDVQRRVRNGHSTTKLPTVELVSAMRLHLRAAHEPRVAESWSRKAGRMICCATRLRSRPAWGVITTLSAVAAPDNAHPQSAQGHPMPATRSAPKGPHQGAG
jgi:hypothetical protein